MKNRERQEKAARKVRQTEEKENLRATVRTLKGAKLRIRKAYLPEHRVPPKLRRKVAKLNADRWGKP